MTAGRSTLARWATAGRSFQVAPGTRAATSRLRVTKKGSSRSPHTTAVGTVTSSSRGPGAVQRQRATEGRANQPGRSLRRLSEHLHQVLKVREGTLVRQRFGLATPVVGDSGA